MSPTKNENMKTQIKSIGATLKQMQAEEFRRCLSDYSHAIATGQNVVSASLRVHTAATSKTQRAEARRVLASR